MLVAEYDGVKIYDSDVADIINYQLIQNTDETTTEQELQNIMATAVQTYVKYQLMEIDLAEKGYKIDEAAYKQAVKDSKKQLDDVYGYKEWCEMYRVSKDFLAEDIRRYYIADLYYGYAKSSVEVTEIEAKDYYTINALEKYTAPAGYNWTSVLIPVKNYVDAAEMSAAKAEAQAYIAKLQNNEIKFEDVQKEVSDKYTSEKGYASAIFSGEDFTSMSDMVDLSDETMANLLAQLDEVYANRDLNAAADTEEYSNYMLYVSNVFKANVYYALQRMEAGEIWGEAFESPAGYYIVRLDSISMTNDFVPFEDVKDEIVTILISQKLEEGLVKYFSDLEVKYGAIYYVA